MVHLKSKKVKGDEVFQKKKQKVGRRKLLPATETRAEITVRKLHVRTAVGVCSDENALEKDLRFQKKDGKADTSVLFSSFRDCVIGVRHYKPAVRRSSFQAISRLLSFDVIRISSIEQLSLLDITLHGCADADHMVRKASLGTFGKFLLVNRPETSFSISGEVLPDSNEQGLQLDWTQRILQHVRLALTHTSREIRQDGGRLLGIFLMQWPGAVRKYLHTNPNLINHASGFSITSISENDLSTPLALVSKILPQLSQVVIGTPEILVLTTFLREICSSHQLWELFCQRNGLKIEVVQSETSLHGENKWVSPQDVVANPMIGTTSSFSSSLMPILTPYSDNFLPKLLLQWKELMEHGLALFRSIAAPQKKSSLNQADSPIMLSSSSLYDKAVAVGESIMHLTDWLLKHSQLDTAKYRSLCHSLLVDLRFSMETLLKYSNHGTDRIGVGGSLSLAEIVVFQASTLYSNEFIKNSAYQKSNYERDQRLITQLIAGFFRISTTLTSSESSAVSSEVIGEHLFIREIVQTILLVMIRLISKNSISKCGKIVFPVFPSLLKIMRQYFIDFISTINGSTEGISYDCIRIMIKWCCWCIESGLYGYLSIMGTSNSSLAIEKKSLSGNGGKHSCIEDWGKSIRETIGQIPRFLFSARHIPDPYAEYITENLVKIVHLVVRQDHPVLAHMNLTLFAWELQSLFGFSCNETETSSMSGKKDNLVVSSPLNIDTSTSNRHETGFFFRLSQSTQEIILWIFFYLNQLPRIHDTRWIEFLKSNFPVFLEVA